MSVGSTPYKPAIDPYTARWKFRRHRSRQLREFRLPDFFSLILFKEKGKLPSSVPHVFFSRDLEVILE